MSAETNAKPKDRVSPTEPGLTLAARSSLDVMLYADPSHGDRRFGERAWQDNWLFHRLMQAYLKPAPKTLGSRKHQATAKAPGGYVHAS
jgi:hypothetical protein